MKNFKDKTKFGQFLSKASNKGLNVISAIGKAKNGDFIGAYEDVKQVLSKEPNETNDNLLSELIKKKSEFKSDYQLFLEDTQDARANETIRDTSENSSWLTKNIHEIIAVVVIGGWIVTWYNKPVIPTVEITGAVMLILGYLYGRSKPQS